MNNRDLMSIRADTLYTYDARGRMLCSNEPREQDRRPAPRLFLGRTHDGDVVRFGATLPDALVRQLETAVSRLPPLGDLLSPPTARDEVGELLSSDAPITAVGGGPAYRFPVAIPQTLNALRLTSANRELVRDTYPWLYDEASYWQPCAAVVHEGAAVSVCFSARLGNDAAEAGLDTLPAYRRRGYATAVAAAWGAAVRESDRIPLYSTAWDNHDSQAVAHRLGLIAFGIDTTWN